MKIEKKTKPSSTISTASMPDIIFMLLIFFMVTTVIRENEGLPLQMPRAKMIEKLESKRHTSHIWATKDGVVSIDDRLVNVNSIRHIIYSKIVVDPQITVSLKADKDAPMKLVTDIHEEMRQGSAFKLSYAALREGAK